MIGDRDVIVIHDDRMLNHRPNVEEPFLPGRLASRVQAVLGGSGLKWSYPEHPGRLSAIIDLLRREPVPGVRYEAARSASQEQLARVHTTSYLEDIYALRGKQAWLDVDTTAVSPGS
ncbi:MAG TPA: histone deacetylase, partial [Modicisalibacter sp.]|nr:histone deacetylase [Modicisalibacter sp.]